MVNSSQNLQAPASSGARPKRSPGRGGNTAATSSKSVPTTVNQIPAELSSDPSSKLCVIKIGTSSLMTEDSRIKLPSIGRLIETIMKLRKEGHRVVLVSSGAQGCGRIKLGLAFRPTSVSGKQAVAAAGQAYLMRIYEDLFEIASGGKQKVAQLLITRRDFSSFVSFSNIKSTVEELLRWNVIPIINENDAVHPTTGLHEKFGDNDQLAALTAINLEADWLFLLTDVDYVYTSNPTTDPNARPIFEVTDLKELQKVVETSPAPAQPSIAATPHMPAAAEGADADKASVTEVASVEQRSGSAESCAASANTAANSAAQQQAGGGSTWGTGGMQTKLVAAKLASVAGIECVLVNGAVPERILAFLQAARAQSAEPQQDASSTTGPATSSSSASSSSAPKLASSRSRSNSLVYLQQQQQASSVGGAQSTGLVGTFFHANPSVSTLRYQRRWILALPPKGKIFVNHGAAQALLKKKSLFAVGVVAVEGDFLVDDCVEIYQVSSSSTSPVVKVTATPKIVDLRQTGSTVGIAASIADSPASESETEQHEVVSPKTGVMMNNYTAVSNDHNDKGTHQTQTDGNNSKGGTSTSSSHKGDAKSSRSRRGGRRRGDSEESARSARSAKCGAAQNLSAEAGSPVVEPSEQFAQAIVEFTSQEIRKIMGLRSAAFEARIGYAANPEVCHRENIFLLH
ncbi:unnamed protein product [Amoebophrya sp. A25]|nr:unnamed protein product [Amoebophrya sp. A25]|eukprot:GSA25T00002211001.1